MTHKPCRIKNRPTSFASSGFSDLSHTSREDPIRKTIELLVEAKPSANLGEVNLVDNCYNNGNNSKTIARKVSSFGKITLLPFCHINARADSNTYSYYVGIWCT